MAKSFFERNIYFFILLLDVQSLQFLFKTYNDRFQHFNICEKLMFLQWAAAEKYIFSVVNVSGHRLDIEVLSTVLNVNFALI
jgi:hypothetical protein